MTRSNRLRREPPPLWMSHVYGEPLRMAVSWYLGQLRWSSEGGFSLVELAIDFAVVTGCDICPVLQGETDDGVQLMRRVRTWGRACNLLATADPGALPATDESRWLYRLGGAREKYKCFVERPIVGDRTVEALKSLRAEMQAVALRKDLASLRRPVADGVRRRRSQGQWCTSERHAADWRLRHRLRGVARGRGDLRLPGENRGWPHQRRGGVPGADGGFSVAPARREGARQEDRSHVRLRLRAGGSDGEHGREVQAVQRAATSEDGEIPLWSCDATGRSRWCTTFANSTCGQMLWRTRGVLPEVTSVWPEWHPAEAQEDAQELRVGRARGWQGERWGRFCLSDWTEQPAVRPWEQWLEDTGEEPHRGDSPRRIARNAMRRVGFRRAGEPEAPA